MSNFIIDDESAFQKVVQCRTCGKYHDLESKAFVKIVGNIYIGFDGGIVGNNITNEGDRVVITPTVYCVNCFVDYLKKSFNML